MKTLEKWGKEGAVIPQQREAAAEGRAYGWM